MTIPTPRYSIGDTVYRARTTSHITSLPCPDCRGTRKWKVTTPAGEEFECSCQRCAENYSHVAGDLPPLKAIVWSGGWECLTIGSVRINTADKPGEVVSYMCRETGIGSGTIHYENRLFPTKAEALAAGEAEAAGQNMAEAAKPAVEHKRRMAALRLTDALFEQCRSATWSAWYAYRRLAEDVGEFVETMPKGEARDALAEMVSFDDKYRDPVPLDALVSAAGAVCATEAPAITEASATAVEALRKALDALPFAPRPKPAAETVLP